MELLRVGVIGIGNMGTAHVRSFGEGHIEGAVLSAVADINAARLDWVRENFPQAKCFASAEELIASGCVDAVVIAVPHYFHPPIAICAFEHGLHVLTEKPAGVQVSAVQKMIEAAKKSGKTFGIMFNQRTNPLFAKARQLVQSGELGKPERLVWIITNWYRDQAYYDSGSWRASWNGEGGGVLLNQAPHNLDLWQWIFGMPKRVRGFCTVGKYHNIEVEDDATIYAEYENGAVATFITTTGEYPGTNRLEITGDCGKLVIENGMLKHWRLSKPEREFRFLPEGGQRPEILYEETVQTEPETAHRGILQNFVDAVRKGTPLLAPGEDGLNELSISNAAYLSAWTDSWAEIPVDTGAFDAELQKRKDTGAAMHKAVEEARDGEYKTRWSVSW